jgi:hypothetical protein
MALILNGTDGLSDVDGSASTPAIRGTDTNTGIFFPAADTIAFAEGGVESMRIDSSGNVGIGTSSPAGRLDVSGLNDTGGVALLVRNTSDIGNTTPFIDLIFTQRTNNADSGRIRIGRDGIYSATASTMDSFMAFYTAINNADTERMRIDSSGNVGIGETSPAGSANYTQLAIRGTNGAEISLKQGATTYAYMYCNSGAGFVQDAVGASGKLVFQTNSTERMRIDSSGNLLFNSGYGSVATAYGCRAWVNFNGTSTVAIRSSGNVSSITDNGTGDYTVNLTTAMPDGNYSAVASGGTGGNNIRMASCAPVSATSTSQIRVIGITINASALIDLEVVSVAIFR